MIRPKVVRVALVALVFLAAAPVAAGLDPRCHVPDALIADPVPLPRFAAALARGGPVRIVAIGSSSTYGAGASSPAQAYPARLEAALRTHYPGVATTVLNRGVNGHEAGEMIRRFDRDVRDERPDLVLWQFGTNAALSGATPDAFRRTVRDGLERLGDFGVDVVVITPQFAPRFNEVPNRKAFLDAIERATRQHRVGVFDRHAIMRHWVDSGQMSFAAMLTPDGLHHNDLGYACFAEALAAQLTRRPDNRPRR
ncbi:MAG: SGNH/GDSL hydrolase family protein [Alphaproteobacteria bacterium]|nr:SGNH/GDSL hydrolase family protein [Alphaproteobacteria bacterium]